MAKIVIIDSGVNINHPKLAKYNIKGMSLIKDDEGNIKIDDTFDDTYGHGTAVTNLICKNSEHNDVFMIKIFYNDYQAEEELLTAALTYVYENMECDIVNMSLGLTEYESLTHLRDICNKLNKKGVILISAFDNFGSVSFPAAFDNVIGVETSFSVKKNKEYEYVENSYVNILAKGGLQRVAWTNQDFIITKGNSFATPFITCVVADAINKNEVNISNVHKYLKENAINIVDNSYKVEDNKPIAFVPQKAVIFPFNKEMHSIVRFHNKLEFEFEVCDVRESGLVGSNTSFKVNNSDYSISNIMNLDWNKDFDTIILGHCEELSILTKMDIKKYILENCIEHKKNIFSFDDLSKEQDLLDKLKENNLKFYYPQIDLSDVPNNSFDKLYYIPKTILAICGTSSSQGKFTLQANLRRKFIEKGFKVGQIGTEPSALLYGYDAVCPIGYGANVRINDYRFISAVNKMFFEVSQKDCDIIITGTQSGTIPYSYDTLRNIPVYSMEFLMGIKPDRVVLCVNAFDEVDYLKRTIGVIENLYDTKVIALSLFPFTYENNWAGNSGLRRNITEEEKNSFITNAMNIFHKSVYCMDSEEQLDSLFEKVLNYYLSPNEED